MGNSPSGGQICWSAHWTSGHSARRTAKAGRACRAGSTDFLYQTAGFQLPAVHLLAEPRQIVRDSTCLPMPWSRNARMLEGVLEDFGVKGEIIHVRPGPS